MTRRVVAVIALLVLGATPLHGQEQPQSQFTVNVAYAAVRQAPSVASPEVGQAQKGAVLEITRDIGAWVKVAWPSAPDGVGYVHQSMGTRSRPTTLEERVAVALATPPTETHAAMAAPSAQAQGVPGGPAPIPMNGRTVYVAAPTHIIGLGGRISGTTDEMTAGGFGFTTRIWSRSRFGVQMDVSRSNRTSETAVGKLTALQFAPSLIYSLPDRVGDNLWLRPYVGGGVSWNRLTLKENAPGNLALANDNAMGVRGFGGAEFTLPAIPRFAISADAGYLWSQETAFPGFELSRFTFALSGHWYVK
jgi:hypothetical protein